MQMLFHAYLSKCWIELGQWNLHTSLASPCMTKVHAVDFHYSLFGGEIDNLHVVPPVSTWKQMSTSQMLKKAWSAHSMSMLHKQTGPAIPWLNVEGLTRPKCEIIQNISIILLQETHSTSDGKIKIYSFSLVGAIHHDKHNVVTLVRNDLPANLTAKCNGLLLLSTMNQGSPN